MPLISVLTPIYNTSPVHLRECIESVLAQTFPDFEFIILNDSPENTELDKIVKSYTDSRIRYVKNDCNIGISASRNKLIRLSRGKYLAILDHDDIAYPTRLACQVNFLNSHPHIDVVGTWAHWFGTRNFIRKNPQYDTEIKIKLTDRCALMHTTVMLRKSVLTDNDIWYEDAYTPAEDYRLFGRLMDVATFHNLPIVLAEYRCSSNNTSHTQKQRMDIAHKSIVMQICNKYPMYRLVFENTVRHMRFRLFGAIPLIKIKNRWVLLFDCIPIVKIQG